MAVEGFDGGGIFCDFCFVHLNQTHLDERQYSRSLCDISTLEQIMSSSQNNQIAFRYRAPDPGLLPVKTGRNKLMKKPGGSVEMCTIFNSKLKIIQLIGTDCAGVLDARS